MKLIATAWGTRAACSANNAGTDLRTAGGLFNSSRLPHRSTRVCSASSSTSIDERRREGSAVIDATTRCQRAISASMLSASNTSVRNSTAPAMPAGSPAMVQRSPKEKVRSIRAVWVSTDSGSTRRSPRRRPSAGPVSCQGRFCQASATCTSG
ncbi:Uncharacterised protein [Mycobacteroides abscessus subsp. abscessus]|nr:Uncharacterised protein [Mycobacteroides abscessus subsp. abscessus]